MQVIKDRAMTRYPWSVVDTFEPLMSGNIIMPLARYLDDKAQILEREAGDIGVSIESDLSISDLAKELKTISVVALNCQQFTDGRVFSQARLLREKYAFQGDILVIGALMKDQLRFMERCGANVFWTHEGFGLQQALSELSAITVQYQPVVSG